MCLLLCSEVRVIVVHPQTPTRPCVNTDVIAQDRQPSIFRGSHRVEMRTRVPGQGCATHDPRHHRPEEVGMRHHHDGGFRTVGEERQRCLSPRS